ncbi:hypothetical protein EUTSA_v10029478mg [Eutrema salsugineum]|uniref:F-box associated beta-propeller type 3 domain-containing protein n=1 Tax=Eutrema salsugineum TaxID=72664 RepID=V4KL85_EUTSA|nr:hypothetical protein EUTSA_v10029478mg [Eutrema salsugineum]
MGCVRPENSLGPIFPVHFLRKPDLRRADLSLYRRKPGVRFSPPKMSSTQSRFIVSLSNGLTNEPEEKLTFFFSFAHEGEESSSLVPNFEMAIPVGSAFDPEFLASHHGFLNVYTDRGLMVCNPSTEQVIKLPRYTLQFVGYDPIGGQHKALSLRPKDGNPSTGHVLHKVLTFEGCQGWRDIEGTLVPYMSLSVGVCINGFIYYGAFASTDFKNPVMVCFDVRSEKFSFIQAPPPVMFWRKDSIFIEYNGKLASIVRIPRSRFRSFDLGILEDDEKHEWSKQTCVFPSSAWDSVRSNKTCFSGTNKAGEIIMVPDVLSPEVQPFYIFYYNVRTNNVRRVRLLGFGDNEEFRRSYGFVDKLECYVRLAPQHVDSIAFLKNHAT